KEYLYNIDYGSSMGHIKVPLEEIKEDYINWLDKNGLEIKLAEAFYCAPGASIPVHSDETDPSESCKMNWAYSEGNTPIDWYSVTPGIELEYRNNSIGGYYLTCDPENYHLAASSLIGQPSLVQISELHGVNNTTEYPWYCLCIVLKEKNSSNHRIGFKHASEILKKYAKNR
ncbi:MAG: hypothetical protein ABFD07_03005, partial [Methanobacterium sp.]